MLPCKFYEKNILVLIVLLLFFANCSEKSPTKSVVFSGPDTLLLANNEKVFFAGANWPWVAYGHDFGQAKWSTGLWSHDGFSSHKGKSFADSQLVVISAAGIKNLRCYLFCDGRASPEFDSVGNVKGFDEYFYSDFDSLISMCSRHQVRINLVIMDYSWLNNELIGSGGVMLGGHAKIITDTGSTSTYLDNCLKPILVRYGQTNVIATWELMNEPEWRLPGFGGDYSTVSTAQLLTFFRKSIALIHQYASQPVTLGCAKYSFMDTWSSLSLDYIQVHCYEKNTKYPPFTNKSDLNYNRPIVIGEFPTKNTPVSLIDYLNASWNYGYAGVFAWSINGLDESSDLNSSMISILGNWCASHKYLQN